jgi:hypothetical protein
MCQLHVPRELSMYLHSLSCVEGCCLSSCALRAEGVLSACVSRADSVPLFSFLCGLLRAVRVCMCLES